MIRATCQCEGVEIVVDAVEPEGLYCYCSICRKISGSPFASAVSVRRGGLRVERGKELLHKYNATPEYDRWHCSRCHAPIYGEAPGNVDLPLFVPAGLFDGEDLAHVKFSHMFVRSLVPWHQIRDDAPKFETYPA